MALGSSALSFWRVPIFNHIKLLFWSFNSDWHNTPSNFLFWFSWLLLWFAGASFGSNWWSISWVHERGPVGESVDGGEDNAGRVPPNGTNGGHSDPDSFNSTSCVTGWTWNSGLCILLPPPLKIYIWTIYMHQNTPICDISYGPIGLNWLFWANIVALLLN